jgi:hypothetical protein
VIAGIGLHILDRRAKGERSNQATAPVLAAVTPITITSLLLLAAGIAPIAARDATALPAAGGPAGVLARHMPTAGAAIAADRDQQRRRAPPQRFVRQPPGHAVARRSLASAAATPPGELVGLDDPAGQHRTPGLEPLTHDLQAEFVKTAERAQAGGQEGSVRHVAPIGLRGMSRCRHAYQSTDFEGVSARIR